MKHFLFFIVGALSFSFSAGAEVESHKLVQDWVVKMDAPQDVSEEVTRFFVGGISSDAESFVVSGEAAYVSSRSVLSGQPIWKTALAGESQASWHVSGDQIFGADSKGFAYAIDRQSGDILWERRTRGMFFAEPIADEERVYILNSQGSLVALNRGTGEWLWQQGDTESSLFNLISRHGLSFFEGRILAGFPSGVLQAYRPGTGERLWTDSFSSLGVDSLGLNDLKALQAEGAYLAASSYAGNLRLWKAQAGSRRLLWDKQQSLHTAPFIDSEASRIYVSDREGRLQSYELDSGFSNWEFQLPRGLATQAAVKEDRIWFGSTSGEVYVLNREGEVLASLPSLGSAILNSPVLVDKNTALVVTTKGILRKIRLVNL